ncbi:MAG: hypothetical protein KDD44_02750, partial [Bdellovibrionales bacterium]|nr:hypothetical protein [Bdellovibrionales bacterium]
GNPGPGPISPFYSPQRQAQIANQALAHPLGDGVPGNWGDVYPGFVYPGTVPGKSFYNNFSGEGYLLPYPSGGMAPGDYVSRVWENAEASGIILPPPPEGMPLPPKLAEILARQGTIVLEGQGSVEGAPAAVSGEGVASYAAPGIAPPTSAPAAPAPTANPHQHPLGIGVPVDWDVHPFGVVYQGTLPNKRFYNSVSADGTAIPFTAFAEVGTKIPRAVDRAVEAGLANPDGSWKGREPVAPPPAAVSPSASASAPASGSASPAGSTSDDDTGPLVKTDVTSVLPDKSVFKRGDRFYWRIVYSDGTWMDLPSMPLENWDDLKVGDRFMYRGTPFIVAEHSTFGKVLLTGKLEPKSDDPAGASGK